MTTLAENVTGNVQTNLKRGMLGGFIATLVMTFMMYFLAPMMLGKPMDVAAMLSSMLGGQWWAGMMMHFLLGTVAFPLAYLVAIQPYVAGPGWVRGLVFGFLAWLAAAFVVVPMMGGGVLYANAGGTMAASASLMGHLVFGVVLGAIVGKPINDQSI